MEPIYEAMKHQLCEHEVLHGDETVLQVLKEPGKTAQSKSYMWLFRTSGEAKRQIVLYKYQPDRKHTHPEKFLKNFSGYLHADGYDGYHKLPENITVVGCWAHLRRKFFDALKTLPKDKQSVSHAAKGVTYCDKLFHFEKQLASLTPENRHKERERLSKLLMDEFFNWMEHLNALPNTLLGKAAHYARSQRKNWLFSNTPNGARASAIYYSLIVAARENGFNPFEYLTWIFDNAPNLGKPGYATTVVDFLPSSGILPQKVFSPKPKDTKTEKHAWEEYGYGSEY